MVKVTTSRGIKAMLCNSLNEISDREYCQLDSTGLSYREADSRAHNILWYHCTSCYTNLTSNLEMTWVKTFKNAFVCTNLTFNLCTGNVKARPGQKRLSKFIARGSMNRRAHKCDHLLGSLLVFWPSEYIRCYRLPEHWESHWRLCKKVS